MRNVKYHKSHKYDITYTISNLRRAKNIISEKDSCNSQQNKKTHISQKIYIYFSLNHTLLYNNINTPIAEGKVINFHLLSLSIHINSLDLSSPSTNTKIDKIKIKIFQ